MRGRRGGCDGRRRDGYENTRVELLFSQMVSGQLDSYTAFVDQCLEEYDLDGWTVPDLASYEDLQQIRNDVLNG